MSNAKEYAEWLRANDAKTFYVASMMDEIADFIESQAARLKELEPEEYANVYENGCLGSWHSSREAAEEARLKAKHSPPTHILIRKGDELRVEKVE